MKNISVLIFLVNDKQTTIVRQFMKGWSLRSKKSLGFLIDPAWCSQLLFQPRSQPGQESGFDLCSVNPTALDSTALCNLQVFFTKVLGPTISDWNGTHDGHWITLQTAFLPWQIPPVKKFVMAWTKLTQFVSISLLVYQPNITQGMPLRAYNTMIHLQLKMCCLKGNAD